LNRIVERYERSRGKKKKKKKMVAIDQGAINVILAAEPGKKKRRKGTSAIVDPVYKSPVRGKKRKKLM